MSAKKGEPIWQEEVQDQETTNEYLSVPRLVPRKSMLSQW